MQSAQLRLPYAMKDAEELSQSVKVRQQKEEDVRKAIRGHSTSNTYLELVSRSICVVPDELFMLPNIEYLYLESNHLQELPDDFFENLPMLKWLDLRDNKLEYLPPSIGMHRNLKNLLLEKNQLTHLPLELGNVTTLTGLSLRGNPLELPPPEIVEQGVQEILSYLLDALNSLVNAAEVDDENEWRYGEDGEYSDEEEDDRFSLYSTQNGNRAVENEMGLQGPKPVPAMFHQPRSRGVRHTNTPWKDGQTNGATPGGAKINQLDLTNSKRDRQQEQIGRKNWLAKMQQKQRDTMVLDEWRQEAKRLQNLLAPKSRNENNRVVPPYGVNTSPADGRPVTEQELKVHIDAVEEKVDRVEPKNSKPKAVSRDGKESGVKAPSPKLAHTKSDASSNSAISKRAVVDKREDGRRGDSGEQAAGLRGKRIHQRRPAKQLSQAVRERIDNEVQARIRHHTSQLRHRKQKDASSLLQPGRELQRELLDQKMSRDPELEYRFRAFTGDSSSFSSSKKTSSL